MHCRSGGGGCQRVAVLPRRPQRGWWVVLVSLLPGCTAAVHLVMLHDAIGA
jgi:hypothetical protein